MGLSFNKGKGNMIVILSEENDQSTNDVIDWIAYYGKDYVRINPADAISEMCMNSNYECRFICRGKQIELNKVTAFWYRRGHLSVLTRRINDNEFLLAETLNKHLKSENAALRDFVLRSLTRRNSLGDYFNTDVDKLTLLMYAKKIGLDVPETIVTTSKQELRSFHEKHSSLITKSTGNVIMSIENGISAISYTKRITLTELESLEDSFSSSLFQEEIIKRYELRIFFIDDQFYPMAIFSQLDSQTTVDFRVYNRTKPNRTVPYKLPQEIEEKLYKLMQHFGFNTGSIDMIVTKENSFVFLEVNPVGQFDMVSAPCNYYLPKKIAERLCVNTPQY